MVHDLEYQDQLLQTQRLGGPKPVVIENVYKKFAPVVRPSTPSVVEPPDEHAQNAALLLQRMLRGRMAQNLIYEGKQKALPLIRELRLAENPVPEEEKDGEELHDLAVDTMAGEISSHALDFIAKDIMRVAEEKKIAALVILANYRRRVLEAEETGRRQAEDILRKKQEQHFEMVMEVHASTADIFLSDIFTSALQDVAAVQASAESSLKATVLEDIIGSVEERLNAPDFIVNDLVSSFLLPEVDRQNTKRRENMEKRRFMRAASSALKEAVQGVSGKIAAKKGTAK